MKATWNDTVIAEAPKEDLIYIEGNWYFPPASLNKNFATDSSTHTTCFWKGEASYFNLVVDGQENPDAVWYYPSPLPNSIPKVGKDYTDYVAFWRGVEVSE
jgi:uncharacterized protein (DUF427 family)